MEHDGESQFLECGVSNKIQLVILSQTMVDQPSFHGCDLVTKYGRDSVMTALYNIIPHWLSK